MRRGTVSDMVDYIRNGYWEEWFATSPGDGHWRKFNFSSSGDHAKSNKLRVHFDEDDSVPEEIKDIVKDAFDYVGDVLNITVTYRVGDGDDGDVNIHKDDFLDIFGTDYAHAEADLGWFGEAGYFQVNPDILYEEDGFDMDDPYARQSYVGTFIHELSHLLGLGHTGNYNGDSDLSVDRSFTNDSSGWSIMSYVPTNEFGEDGFEFAGRAITYREVDLRALALHYDIDFSMEEADTVWGFNGTVSHDFINQAFSVRIEQRLAENGTYYAPGLTIIDTGGHDTLNLRTSVNLLNTDNVVRLTPDSYSNVLGGIRNLYIFDGSVIEDVVTADGNDRVIGNGVANTIMTGGRNDTVRGNGGADSIYGDAGEDKLYGGGGGDRINGGADNDTVYGQSGGDSLYGDAGTDKLYGGNGNDTLDAGAGADSAYGGNGRDTLWAGDGGLFSGQRHNDTVLITEVASADYTLIGGTGTDVLAFDAQDGATGFKLNVDTHEITDYATGNAEVIDFSGFEKILGSDNDDYMLIYADADNAFTYVNGADGEDEIRVHTDAVTVTGGAGADTLITSADNNTIRGGSNDDIIKVKGVLSTLDGQTGTDTAVFLGASASTVAVNTATRKYAYDVSLADLATVETGRLQSFETFSVALDLALDFSGRNIRETVTGSSYSDLIEGKGGADVLSGGDGQDTIRGNNGADVLYGGWGNDTLIGGQGRDTIYGEAGSDLIRTGSGDDSVEGGSGHDTIHAGTGTEVLLGDSGDDWFYVETGEKSIDGGEDYDRLIFLGKLDRVVLLDEGKYDDESGLVVNYTNIEEVETRDGNDSIVGSAGDNVLIANDGLDTVQGGQGDDTLYGGAGWDTLEFGTDADIEVNLETSIASGEGNDEIHGFEVVITNGGDDTIIGDDGQNSLIAGSGNDSLVSGGERDSLYGGAGNDTLIAGDGTDYVYGEEGYDFLGFDEAVRGVTFSLASGAAQSTGAGSIRANGVEGLIGTAGHDRLTGDSGDNIIHGEGGRDTLSGGLGDDTLYGGAGSDTFVYTEGDGTDVYYGGSGSDWVDFSALDEALWIHMPTGTISPSALEGDTWDSIENIRGGTAGDTLFGNGDGNALDGHKGDDTLYGLSGADELTGGLGADHLYGGAGDDTLSGDDGADHFVMETRQGRDIINDFNGEAGDRLIFTYVPDYVASGRAGADGTLAALPMEFTVMNGMLTLLLSDQDSISFKELTDIEQVIPFIEYDLL